MDLTISKMSEIITNSDLQMVSSGLVVAKKPAEISTPNPDLH